MSRGVTGDSHGQGKMPGHAYGLGQGHGGVKIHEKLENRHFGLKRGVWLCHTPMYFDSSNQTLWD